MKSVTIQRAGIFLGVLFFIWSNPAGAGDPGKPDSVYLEYGGISKGALSIKIMFVTDNVGDSNKIRGFGFPLLITNSNPAAKPVLDTTLSATYSGSAIKDFAFISTYVPTNKGNPGIFPLRYVLGAFNVDRSSPTNIRAGRYLIANIMLRLQDTTTICIDTLSTPTVILGINTVASGSYIPKWRATCCQANSSYKPKDAKSKKKQKP